MLMSSTEFFSNLPPKECSKCGEVVEEMHECYSNECLDCESEVKWWGFLSIEGEIFL